MTFTLFRAGLDAQDNFPSRALRMHEGAGWPVALNDAQHAEHPGGGDGHAMMASVARVIATTAWEVARGDAPVAAVSTAALVQADVAAAPVTVIDAPNAATSAVASAAASGEDADTRPLISPALAQQLDATVRAATAALADAKAQAAGLAEARHADPAGLPAWRRLTRLF